MKEDCLDKDAKYYNYVNTGHFESAHKSKGSKTGKAGVHELSVQSEIVSQSSRRAIQLYSTIPHDQNCNCEQS